MSTATQLSAEEFAALPDDGRRLELVKGEVVEMNLPVPRHGQVCSKIDRIVGTYAEEFDHGHVVCNDTGVLTSRDPDTVRGADVAFYSYAKVPKGKLPIRYLDVAPDMVFEVFSPDDRWSRVHVKIGEYLSAGVSIVCVLDPKTETVRLFFPDRPNETLSGDDELTAPAFLGEFRVAVRRFFE